MVIKFRDDRERIRVKDAFKQAQIPDRIRIKPYKFPAISTPQNATYTIYEKGGWYYAIPSRSMYNVGFSDIDPDVVMNAAYAAMGGIGTMHLKYSGNPYIMKSPFKITPNANGGGPFILEGEATLGHQSHRAQTILQPGGDFDVIQLLPTGGQTLYEVTIRDLGFYDPLAKQSTSGMIMIDLLTNYIGAVHMENISMANIQYRGIYTTSSEVNPGTGFIDTARFRDMYIALGSKANAMAIQLDSPVGTWLENIVTANNNLATGVTGIHISSSLGAALGLFLANCETNMDGTGLSTTGFYLNGLNALWAINSQTDVSTDGWVFDGQVDNTMMIGCKSYGCTTGVRFTSGANSLGSGFQSFGHQSVDCTTGWKSDAGDTCLKYINGGAGMTDVTQFNPDPFTNAEVYNYGNYNKGSTGGGSALLGANSPAITLTAPYTWIKMNYKGNIVYMPVWK